MIQQSYQGSRTIPGACPGGADGAHCSTSTLLINNDGTVGHHGFMVVGIGDDDLV